MRWALLFLLAASAFGQQTNYRWDWQATTTQGVGQRVPVLAEPGVHISFYLCTAGVCTTAATTYQSAASSTACPTGEPVVWQTNSNGSCTAIADPQGKFGGWFQPGLYGYYIGSAGPYFFTIGGGGSSGNISGSLTADCVVLATGVQSVGCSLATDSGTSLAYTGTGGVTAPKYTFGTIGSGVYGVLSTEDDLGPFASLQLFDPTAGGTTVDATGVYTQNIEADYVQSGDALFSGDVRLGELNNGVPGQPILVDQGGGGPIALQVNGGLQVAGEISLSNGPGTSGQTVLSQGTGQPAIWGTASVSPSIAGTTITPGIVNNVVSASGINGAGIGVAQTTWSNSPTYPQCTVVSHSGNYIAVAQNQAVTPGTNAAIWYPVPNANTPTAGDCAFYVAASLVNGTVGSEVLFPPGNSNLNIGLMEPTVTSPGNPVVAVRCAGKSNSTLTQTASISNAMFTQPNSTVNFAFANLDVEGCTFNANFNAPAVMNIYGAQQFKLAHLRLENPADGSDHYIEFGHPSSANHNLAWTYEPELDDIDTLNGHGPGTGAVVTASVSSGVPTFTVSNGGTSYNATYSQLILSGTTGTNVDTPCTSRGTDTIHVTSGVITSITTTATGCATPLYAQVFGGNQVTYCFKFNDTSDAKDIRALTPSECQIGAYFSNNSSQMATYRMHPIGTLIGIQDYANNDHVLPEFDTMYRYGLDFEGATNMQNIYGAKFLYSAALNGVSDYHFGTVTGSPTTAPYQINIFGDGCGNAPSGNNYNHLLQSSGPGFPTFAHIHETTSCSGLGSNTGAVNTPGNFTAAGALQGTSVGATQGTFNAYGGTNLQYEVNGSPAIGNAASGAPLQMSSATLATVTLGTGGVVGWGAAGVPDAGLSRSGAGVLDVGNGTAGNSSGQIKASNAQLGSLYLGSFTVSGLPSASGYGAYAMVIVTDCTSYTPGALCTGGGSDVMIGVSNGTAWTVH